jgi:hypothetical protein
LTSNSTKETMEKRYMKLVMMVCMAVMTMSASAYKSVNVRNQSEGSGNGQIKAAACAPATGLKDLEWNNVSAIIETGGNMWTDRANSRAAYEVPKGGGVSSLYAGALWMGGRSPDQQEHPSAQCDPGEGWPKPEVLSEDISGQAGGALTPSIPGTCAGPATPV